MNEPSILLFLVLKDKRINALLNKLRKIFNGKDSNSEIHITIWGPFKNKVSAKTLRKMREDMRFDVIKIEGVGMFKNDDQNFVYLKLDSPSLSRIWNKPDFPVYKHGFNPHITLYKGNDENRANKIVEFLETESIRLLCEDFEFMSYDLRQRPIGNEFGDIDSFISLEVSGNIQEGLLDRARTKFGDGNEAK